MVMENFLRSLGQEVLDNYFDMRQGKVESILDYIFREEILTVVLKKDTAIDLHEKIRGYWLMNIEPHGTRNQYHHSGADTARAGQKRPTPRRLLQGDMRKSGMFSVKQETERETALVDTLKPRISISMETVMMTKRTGFQNQSQNVQSNGTSWMVKNKKL